MDKKKPTLLDRLLRRKPSQKNDSNFEPEGKYDKDLITFENGLKIVDNPMHDDNFGKKKLDKLKITKQEPSVTNVRDIQRYNAALENKMSAVRDNQSAVQVAKDLYKERSPKKREVVLPKKDSSLDFSDITPPPVKKKSSKHARKKRKTPKPPPPIPPSSSKPTPKMKNFRSKNKKKKKKKKAKRKYQEYNPVSQRYEPFGSPFDSEKEEIILNYESAENLEAKLNALEDFETDEDDSFLSKQHTASTIEVAMKKKKNPRFRKLRKSIKNMVGEGQVANLVKKASNLKKSSFQKREPTDSLMSLPNTSENLQATIKRIRKSRKRIEPNMRPSVVALKKQKDHFSSLRQKFEHSNTNL